MVSAAGGRKGFVYRDQHRRYRALIREGASKTKAAKISNAWHNGTIDHRRHRRQ